MMNGNPGEAVSKETLDAIEKLIGDGHPVDVIAQRAGVSKSMVRLVQRQLIAARSARDIAHEIWPDGTDGQ